MKNALPSLLAASALLVSFNSYAACPQDLDAEAMAECIVIEGSGANYQDWKGSYMKTAASEPATDDTVAAVVKTELEDQ